MCSALWPSVGVPLKHRTSRGLIAASFDYAHLSACRQHPADAPAEMSIDSRISRSTETFGRVLISSGRAAASVQVRNDIGGQALHLPAILGDGSTQRVK
jgi:hypothetical protein